MSATKRSSDSDSESSDDEVCELIVLSEVSEISELSESVDSLETSELSEEYMSFDVLCDFVKEKFRLIVKQENLSGRFIAQYREQLMKCLEEVSVLTNL